MGYVRNEALTKSRRIFKGRMENDTGHRIEFVCNNRMTKANGFKRDGTTPRGRIKDYSWPFNYYRIVGKSPTIPVQVFWGEMNDLPDYFLDHLRLGKGYTVVHMGRVSRHHPHQQVVSFLWPGLRNRLRLLLPAN